MIVIGLDPGSRYTGYGIVKKEGSSLHHVASGRINATKARSFAERLTVIYDGLSQIFAEYKCTDAAIERVFVSANVQSALKLGQARGVALLAIGHANISLNEYAPTKIKQAVTGYGHAQKDHVQLIVSEILRIPLRSLSADAGDALAIAICHARLIEFESKLTDATFANLLPNIQSP